MALLEVSNISYHNRVRSVNFFQEAFQKIAIAGETGSGKTTLLKMIAGLAQPGAGEIYFDNKKVIGPADKLLPGHPGIGYMSQHFELRNNYWIHEILEYANQLAPSFAEHIYRICQIDHLKDRRTDQLSGGEKQRVVLAKLLTTSPKLLLLDEPFSNLDGTHKKIIKQVIHDIGEQSGISFIMASHDAPDILSWADTVLLLRDGIIVQQGKPEQVYQHPADEYCAALLGDYSILENKEGLFARLPEIDNSKNKILLRPEHVLIADDNESSVKAIVEQVQFWGSHYLVAATIDGQLITVRTTHSNFQIGSLINLIIPAIGLTYLT